MILNDDINLLRQIAPFSDLPREALQILAFSCPKHVYKAGDIVFSKGDKALSAFVVFEGEMIIEYCGQKTYVNAGFLMDESALYIETERSCDFMAAKNAKLLVVTSETFMRLLGEFPHSAEKILQKKAHQTQDFVKSLERPYTQNFTSQADFCES